MTIFLSELNREKRAQCARVFTQIAFFESSFKTVYNAILFKTRNFSFGNQKDNKKNGKTLKLVLFEMIGPSKFFVFGALA